MSKRGRRKRTVTKSYFFLTVKQDEVTGGDVKSFKYIKILI